MAGEDLRLSRGPARARLSVGSWGRRLGPDAGSRVGEVEGSDALPSGLGAVSLDEFQLGSQGGVAGTPSGLLCRLGWPPFSRYSVPICTAHTIHILVSVFSLFGLNTREPLPPRRGVPCSGCSSGPVADPGCPCPIRGVRVPASSECSPFPSPRPRARDIPGAPRLPPRQVRKYGGFRSAGGISPARRQPGVPVRAEWQRVTAAAEPQAVLSLSVRPGSRPS